MSVTDRYTQSQTRLRNSATELNVATALWRRDATDAHLAAVAMAFCLLFGGGAGARVSYTLTGVYFHGHRGILKAPGPRPFAPLLLAFASRSGPNTLRVLTGGYWCGATRQHFKNRSQLAFRRNVQRSRVGQIVIR